MTRKFSPPRLRLLAGCASPPPQSRHPQSHPRSPHHPAQPRTKSEVGRGTRAYGPQAQPRNLGPTARAPQSGPTFDVDNEIRSAQQPFARCRCRKRVRRHTGCLDFSTSSTATRVFRLLSFVPPWYHAASGEWSPPSSRATVIKRRPRLDPSILAGPARRRDRARLLGQSIDLPHEASGSAPSSPRPRLRFSPHTFDLSRKPAFLYDHPSSPPRAY